MKYIIFSIGIFGLVCGLIGYFSFNKTDKNTDLLAKVVENYCEVSIEDNTVEIEKIISETPVEYYSDFGDTKQHEYDLQNEVSPISIPFKHSTSFDILTIGQPKHMRKYKEYPVQMQTWENGDKGKVRVLFGSRDNPNYKMYTDFLLYKSKEGLWRIFMIHLPLGDEKYPY
jgi:hypothetical protein